MLNASKQKLFNHLALLDKVDIKFTLEKIFQDNNININENFFLNSTSTYHLKFYNPLTNNMDVWKEPLALKQLFPDFVLDKFMIQKKEEYTLLIDFIKIFLSQILYLDAYFSVKRKQALFLNSIKTYQFTLKTINNRKNLESLFARYFQGKIDIIENIPCKISNPQNFILGKSVIKSKNNTNCIGNWMYSVQNKYYVILEVLEHELDNLKTFYKVYAKKDIFILKQLNLKNRKYLYRFSFSGETLKNINYIKSILS